MLAALTLVAKASFFWRELDLNISRLDAYKAALTAIESADVIEELEDTIRKTITLPQPVIQTPPSVLFQPPIQAQSPVKRSRGIHINLCGWKPLRHKRVQEIQVQQEPTPVEPEPREVDQRILGEEDADKLIDIVLSYDIVVSAGAICYKRRTDPGSSGIL